MKIRELNGYGIPESIINRLVELGYEELTEVQEEAVKHGLFENKNLVISAPTNTGKTFIGELAALNASKRREAQRTFYLVSHKALAEEKFLDFKDKYSDWGLKIAISTGDHTEYDSVLLEYELIIATYEKLNALLVKNPNLVRNIGLVIVDEFQNVGDETRGSKLEILLTKLVQRDTSRKPQVIGLSATIPNGEDLAEWLNADLVETKKREIELREGVLYKGEKSIKFGSFTLSPGDFLYKEFNTGKVKIEKLDIDGLIGSGELMIFFGSTKENVKNFAIRLSENLNVGNNITYWIGEIRSNIEMTPITRELVKCIEKGVAFHHADLLPEERRIVEKAFRKGNIKIISATATLGFGINLPAKTVVFLAYWRGKGEYIPVRDYKNMAGRAGRIGYNDDFGRSVLFAKNEKELERVWSEYVNAPPEEVESQIAKRGDISLPILGLISSGVCKTINELLTFLENTYFGYTYYRKEYPSFRSAFQESIKQEVKNLCGNGFLECSDEKIKATELGKRCAEESLSPKSVMLIYSTLKKIEDQTLYDTSDKVIQPIIHMACCTFDAFQSYAFLWVKSHEKFNFGQPYIEEDYFVSINDVPHDNFLIPVKTTEMLLKWIEGAPYSELYEGYAYATQGKVKNIAETISWIAKGIARIAEKPLFNFDIGFIEFLTTLSDRIYYGVPANAIKIMKLRIPAIHRFRAMQLAQNGYSTLNSLIGADINNLKKVEGIGHELALRIKEYVESYTTEKNVRAKQSQIRRAKEMGRDSTIIEDLYTLENDDFAKAVSRLFKDYVGLSCEYIGDIGRHEPDVLIEYDSEKIAIECKRNKSETKLVTAKEAEEILGKGAKYRPVANVTVGYPDFAQPAIDNVKHTSITLITHFMLVEILINFWAGKIAQKEVIAILIGGKYITKT